MSPNSLRSDCRKFAPNIFNKTKCSNCFKQKEEHSAEALECNRAMRKVSKSGYLFVAPGWDFSIPLNRTKRWQRRWFVLYDDGELNYSVDEHPDTVPQASIDMTQILEVASAEEVTGHAFSLAITAPDRVTFVKAMARDDARAWTNVLAVYTRNKRHKRNATFPGGQTTTTLLQAPRSGTPNPIRPRYNSCHSESLRPTGRYFHDTTPSPTANAAPILPTSSISILSICSAGATSPLSTSSSSTSVSSNSCRNTGYRDQPPSSASPPTRDKLNSEEKAAARTRTKQQNNNNNNNNTVVLNNIEGSDCVDGPIVKSSSVDDYETSSKRLETLKDIAAVLTRPRSLPSPLLHAATRDSDTDTTLSESTASPTSTCTGTERVQLPAETTLLHLKKGWLMLQDNNDWTKLWFVLCGQELKAYRDPKSEELAEDELRVTLSQVKAVGEVQVQRNYGFQVRLWNDLVHTLSAVTSGIRSNWLLSIRRAAGLDELPPRPGRLLLLSSDEEYRTASEGGRRESGEWTPVSPPLARTPISRVKERARTRCNRSSPSSSSRGSTLDSVSTDELLAADELQRLHTSLQRSEHDKLICLNQLKEKDDALNETLEKYEHLNRDYLSKTTANLSLQEELNCVNERLQQGIEENDYLYKKLQEFEGKDLQKNSSFGSLSDLTNIDLDLDLDNISMDHLMDEYNNLKLRFEKAVQEIKAMKRELRDSNLKYDDLELTNITLTQDFKKLEEDNKAQNAMMAARIQDLTQKLTNSEKQVRNLKSKLQDSREKRRSLSLKGRESFSINKEVEDKITELEAKILSLGTKKIVKPAKKNLKRDRSSERAEKSDRSSPTEEKTQRRLRRKSLDSATTSEPMKVLIRLSSLESKVANISDIKSANKEEHLATSTESLNIGNQSDANSRILALESIIEAAKMKLGDCIDELGVLKHARRFNIEAERLATLENAINQVNSILKLENVSPQEVDVISESVFNLVQNFEKLLSDKLLELNKKRQKLRDSGKLTPENSMSILAEKLAYETILISRIHEALNTIHSPESRFGNRILRKEVLETGSLLQQLQSKLSDSHALKPTSKCLESHLVKLLTRHLIHINYITNNKKISLQQQHVREDTTLGLEYLHQKQKEVNQQLQRYKGNKLEQLAYSLALETLNYGEGVEETNIREAWQSAQEHISTELIQSEIAHVLSRVAAAYKPSDTDPQVFMTVWAAERAALELWTDVVEARLEQELEQSSQELQTAVRGALAKLRPATPWRRRLELERKSYSAGGHSARSLLAEFADIIALKASIDARIAVLTGEISSSIAHHNVNNTRVRDLVEGERYLWLLEDSNTLESTSVLETEFQFLYLHHQQLAAQTASLQPPAQVLPVPVQLVQALQGIECQVARLLLQGTPAATVSGGEVTCWNDVVLRCVATADSLRNIPHVVKCSECQQLKDSMHRLSREHSAELAAHESRARQLEQRLGTLDSEYARQLEQLRAAYRETLAAPAPAPAAAEASEGMRARYQSEIEQLRALCEKGLAAVEGTHRRVVAELQDKHRREREQLLEEKEQALAEETQATLAALDAMRKAHEHEVRREVGKFKADFLRRLQATHDLGTLHQQHDTEMRDIKAEILALSERYSVKCVESASLEEQLCSVHQQLENANKYIEKLDKRNKQLETVSIRS